MRPPTLPAAVARVLDRAFRRWPGGRGPDARSLVAWLARVGYATKGGVYLLVGLLAVAAALGSVRHPRGASGALTVIRGQPLGMAVLAVVAAGLAGHVLWRVVQAVFDPDCLGTNRRAIGTRAGYLLSAVLYSGLAAESLRLLKAVGRGEDPGWEAAYWAALLLGHPLGRILAALIAGGIFAFALHELHRARATDPVRRLDLSGTPPAGRRWVVRMARGGLAARGIVFGIVAGLLVRAAISSEPLAAPGMAGALRALEARPYGPWLLGGVGLGLAAYGAYQLASARYRRMVWS